VTEDQENPAQRGEPDSSAVPAQDQTPQTGMPILSVELIEKFSGTLPPPDVLRGYNEIVPGAAERIIKMAEQQAQHRQSLERIVVEGGSKRANTGMWLGFIISMVVLGLSAVLIFNGYQVAGTVIGSVDLVSLAAVFVIGRVDQRRERVQKAAETQVD
jgi:uncharacterized membrane protein